MAERSILICDDEVELAAELGEFFLSCGWDARVCVTAPAALAVLCSGFAPSCLLTDLRIAGHDGAELVMHTRDLPKPLQPKVIAIITGHMLREAEAADFKADFLFVKPFDPVLLMEGIEKLLAGPTARDTMPAMRD